MGEIPRELVPHTPDRLEATFDSALVVNGANPKGDILNAFMGTEVLIGMGQHLLKHMRDEERWGESNKTFDPSEFVIAAYEVARDQTAGEAVETRVHIHGKQPLRMTFDIFTQFWVPRIARAAYGEDYGTAVRSLINEEAGR